MKMAREKSPIFMKVTLFVIVIGLLAAVGAVVYINLYENSFFAERKFEELARNYYENDLYEDFIAEHNGEDLKEAFSRYTNGFTVKLRQLLNTEFLNNNQNYRSYFDTDAFSCDTNTSYAHFTPKEPYGKKDYDVDFNLNCKKN